MQAQLLPLTCLDALVQDHQAKGTVTQFCFSRLYKIPLFIY